MTDGEIEEASVSQLIQAVEEMESYAFLIGAGTSKPEPAGIPLAGELVEKWQRETYDVRDPDDDFDDWVEKKKDENGIDESQQYGFWFAERHPTSGQRREEIQALVEDTPPTPGHVILASLMSDGGDQNYVPHTLTTNFDDLLFDSFYLYLEDKPQVVDHGEVASEFKLTRDRPSIVKLHGHYSYSNLRNTDEETAELHDGMEDILRRTVSEHGLVVVGYGGQEASVMEPLLDAEISEYGIYWCALDSDDSSEGIERFDLPEKVEKLLEQRDSYVVPIEGFVPLMLKFSNQIDGVEPPTRQDLIERAEARADRWDEVVEERREAADEEEEEILDKMKTRSEAEDALEDGEYRKAVDLFSDIIDAGKENAYIYNERGFAKNQLGELEAAIEDYDRAIELNSEHGLAYNNRGLAKRELGEYESAIEDVNRAIVLSPESPHAFGNRANINILIGNFDQALRDADEAVSLSHFRDDKAKSLLLYLVAATVLDADAEEKEEEYRNLCEQDFSTTWNFGELDSWLETTDLEPEKQDRIEELLDLLREHKEESA